MLRFVLAAVVLAVAGCSVDTGTSSQPPSTSLSKVEQPKPPEASIGGTLDLSTQRGRIEVTLKNATLYPPGYQDSIDPKKELIDTEFGIDCTSGQYEASAHNFVLVEDSGRRSNGVIPIFEGAFPTEDLQAGQSASGKVYFPVLPEARSGAKIALVEDNRDLGYWVFG